MAEADDNDFAGHGLWRGESKLTPQKVSRTKTKLPIAPYAGVSYGGFDHRLRPIGGLNINFGNDLSSLVIFDGVKVRRAELIFIELETLAPLIFIPFALILPEEFTCE